MAILKLGGSEFECVESIAAGRLMKLAKAMKGDMQSQLAGMYDFLQAVVLPASRPELDTVLDDDELDFDDINEAVGDLMMAYQEETPARPTKRSSPSSPSPRVHGGTSRAVSSSPATPPKVVSLRPKDGPDGLSQAS